MNLPGAPIALKGFFATQFFTVKDLEKSRDFYVRILGGKVITPENPCLIKLANTWIILNSGGGPTPDKPEVLLETPSDLNRVNSFLNLRVADIWACYKQWSDKGAFFITKPLDNHGWEWRCYMRDPDGYLIEVGQYAQLSLDRFKTAPVKFARQLYGRGRQFLLGKNPQGNSDQVRGTEFSRFLPLAGCDSPSSGAKR